MRLLLTVLLLYSHWTQASFSRGAKHEYVNLSGQLIIQCPQKTVQTSCSNIHMQPWPYDVFFGPQIPSATQIELLASVDDSSEIRRSVVGYEGPLGRSKEINLGVSSLFQRPLLRVGTNNILIKIKDRRDQVLSESNLQTIVSRGLSRVCKLRQVTSNNESDCDSPYSSCQQYFIDQKYCQP